MTREEAIKQLEFMLEQMSEEPPTECDYIDEWLDTNRKIRNTLDMAIKALEQEQKIKVLNRDEAIKKLGTVDIYQASAWITLLNDLKHLGLKICEVEE